MDRGAWWAAIYGVTHSRTRLKRLSSSSKGAKPLVLYEHFLKMYLFLIEDNCFTIRCWFLAYIRMNQPWLYICPLPLYMSIKIIFNFLAVLNLHCCASFSLVVVSGGYSLAVGFSLQWLFLLQSLGSRHTGFL